MFSTLLESRAARQRRTGGSLVSIAFHTISISALVIVTANATVPKEHDEPIEKITFTKPSPPTPIVQPPATNKIYTNAPPALGARIIIPPIDIPTVLPPIDLTRSPTNPDDFSMRSRPGADPGGVVGGTGTAAPMNGIYTDAQVERPVMAAPGSIGPSYPEMLRTAGVEGTVLAQFVVDTTGRADVATFTALKSDNALFTAAVRTALGRMRFLPAEVGGRKVPQLVQQPFQFTVNR